MANVETECCTWMDGECAFSEEKNELDFGETHCKLCIMGSLDDTLKLIQNPKWMYMDPERLESERELYDTLKLILDPERLESERELYEEGESYYKDHYKIVNYHELIKSQENAVLLNFLVEVEKFCNDSGSFEFHINGKVITIESADMLDSRKFQVGYLEEFGKLTPLHENEKLWKVFLDSLVERNEYLEFEAQQITKPEVV